MPIQSSDAPRVPRRSSWKKVVVGNVDFDTIAAAFVFGVGRREEVVLGKQASIQELKDPQILCIAAGGAGQTHLSNYDYEIGRCRSLVKKIFESGKWEIFFWRTNHVFDDAGLGLASEELRSRLKKLAGYISALHEKGEKELRAQMTQVKDISPPTLGSILEAMMVCEKDPVERFFKGIEILAKVVRSGQDPFGAIEGFEIYARS